MVTYEWDIETVSNDGEVLDHHHADRLKDLPTPSTKNEVLVLIRDTETERLWAYVDESRMLPRYFSRPEADGQYHETSVAVPKRFHREIAREMTR